MSPSQKELESSVIALAEKSFQTFCDDISGMFGIDMACSPQDATPETINGLQTRFKDLAVVYSVKAEGTLDGTFQLVLDQQGLFILAGVVAMHPEQMILEDTQFGSLEKARKASNVLKEVGAALAGSWDRVFRKELDGHGRLMQTNTFIGNPWENSKEKIGLDGDEELLFIPYEITVNSYPPFMCGTIFPKAILTGTSQPATEQPASDEEKSQEETASRAPNVSEGSEDINEKAQEEVEEKSQEDTESRAPNVSEGSEDINEKAQEEAEEKSQEETASRAPNVSEGSEDINEKTQEPEQQTPAELEEVVTATDEPDESRERPVSEAIQKMTQSLGAFPEETAPPAGEEKPAISGKEAHLALYAKDIMQKDVVWGNPDDSVQQAFTKIQQHDAGYMIIGNGQVLEGIVSKSDLTGALSPYLRPTFDKWRRPIDDATLQIRVKWIMSKPVSTISPDTPITTIMENMSRTGKRCLPVADEQGSVQGLVTVFDAFKVLLKHSCQI
jgi:CBS domain-containing protein